MRRTFAIATATVMALLFAVTTNGAAQQLDTLEKTMLTFSNAVELPGMTLEPGTYVFRVSDNPSRNVVQVLSEDGKPLGQWFFAPAQRQEVTSDTVVLFRETSAGSTPAIQYWYYPGRMTGKEFMYPKDQALRIASRTGATVLTEQGPVTPETADDVQAAAQPKVAQEQVGAIEGSGLPQPVATTGRNDDQPVVDAQAEKSDYPGANGVRPESTVARNDAGQNELPHTSSPLALGGLISLLSLAGAAGLRALRR